MKALPFFIAIGALAALAAAGGNGALHVTKGKRHRFTAELTTTTAVDDGALTESLLHTLVSTGNSEVKITKVGPNKFELSWLGPVAVGDVEIDPATPLFTFPGVVARITKVSPI